MLKSTKYIGGISGFCLASFLSRAACKSRPLDRRDTQDSHQSCVFMLFFPPKTGSAGYSGPYQDAHFWEVQEAITTCGQRAALTRLAVCGKWKQQHGASFVVAFACLKPIQGGKTLSAGDCSLQIDADCI